jgi:DNA mismatch repair protein MutL
LLRNQDIANSFDELIKQLGIENTTEAHSETAWQIALAELMLNRESTQAYALQVWRNAESHFNCQFEQQLRLNSVVIDLTSFINQIE